MPLDIPSIALLRTGPIFDARRFSWKCDNSPGRRIWLETFGGIGVRRFWRLAQIRLSIEKPDAHMLELDVDSAHQQNQGFRGAFNEMSDRRKEASLLNGGCVEFRWSVSC